MIEYNYKKVEIIDFWHSECKARGRPYWGPAILPLEQFPRRGAGTNQRRAAIAHVMMVTDHPYEYYRWALRCFSNPNMKKYLKYTCRPRLTHIVCVTPAHISIPTEEDEAEQQKNRKEPASASTPSTFDLPVGLPGNNNLSYISKMFEETLRKTNLPSVLDMIRVDENKEREENEEEEDEDEGEEHEDEEEEDEDEDEEDEEREDEEETQEGSEDEFSDNY
jgi:hypothetical protein